jgi:regulator of protease activity HflC (stomatin/prohibitin superfamily)
MTETERIYGVRPKTSLLPDFLRSSYDGSGIGRALRALCAIQAIVISAAIAAYFWFPITPLLSRTVLVIGTALVLYGLGELILAKKKALRGEIVSIWKGFAELVSWNPTEGVLFLKNKQIHFVDSNPNDGGGIRVMFPHWGEELVLRVPLEIQTLSFKDGEVLTKEYVPLAIQGTMYWKVMDLGKFYLLISKEVHFANDTGKHDVKTSATRPKFEVAEFWLRSMAEEKTRTVVSQIGTGLLIADKLQSDLPAALLNQGETLFGGTAPQTSSANRSATEGLANAIKTQFAASVSEYGLEIHRVALQEVRLPPEIYAAAVEACKSAYLPIKAKAEAIARKLKLQAEADVIGTDATGMKEIAGNIPALAFQEFLAPLFLDFNKKRAAGMIAHRENSPRTLGD